MAASWIRRGILTLSNGAKKMRVVQFLGLGGRKISDKEHWEPYGFTSEPEPGAENLYANLNESSDHVAVLCIADRRYRPTDLLSGEVVLYRKGGAQVRLKLAEIFIGTDAGLVPIKLQGPVTSTASMGAPAATFGTLGFTTLGGGGGISGVAGVLGALGFKCNGVPGLTVDVPVGPVTLHFKGGLFTGVT